MDDGLVLSDDEVHVHSGEYTPSLLLFWLRVQLALTNKRITGRQPNTVLGFIPVGSVNVNQPLKNVSRVEVASRFRIFRVIAGALFLLFGLALLGQSAVFGFLVVLLGAAMIATSWLAELTIFDTSGQKTRIPVSALEKSALEDMSARINSQLANS